jgi:replication-associated recombination protein RarA
VAETYLPAELRGRVYYQPSNEGREGKLAERVRALRAAAEAAERGEPAGKVDKPPAR